MSVTIFNIDTELRKFLQGKKTKADKDGLLYLTADYYLRSHKKKKEVTGASIPARTAHRRVGKRRSFEELERMFRLKDPRGK